MHVLSAWMMKDVVNKIFVDQDRGLFWIPMAISALFVIKGIAAYLQEVSLSRIGNRIVAEIQKRMYDHMLKMGVGFYQKYPSSDLITRMTHNAQAARTMLNLVAVGLGRDLLTLVGLIAVMVSQDPLLAAICLIGGPFAAMVLKKLTERVQKASRGNSPACRRSSGPCGRAHRAFASSNLFSSSLCCSGV